MIAASYSNTNPHKEKCTHCRLAYVKHTHAHNGSYLGFPLDNREDFNLVGLRFFK